MMRIKEKYTSFKGLSTKDTIIFLEFYLSQFHKDGYYEGLPNENFTTKYICNFLSDQGVKEGYNFVNYWFLKLGYTIPSLKHKVSRSGLFGGSFTYNERIKFVNRIIKHLKEYERKNKAHS